MVDLQGGGAVGLRGRRLLVPGLSKGEDAQLKMGSDRSHETTAIDGEA